MGFLGTLIETFELIVLSFFYSIEALFRLVVPQRRKSVANETVLITGAGSGIGRLLSLEFARLKVTLVLWDINEEGNEETAQMAREQGSPRVHVYHCDCGRSEEVARVAALVKKEVGDVTMLVNNAGIVIGKNFIDTSEAEMQKVMDVNIMAHFWTYKAFLPAMIARNHGHLVSIASAAGYVTISGLADYCGSKFAAVGFAESVALEMIAMKKDGVKTTIVCPAFINTGMFDGCKPQSKMFPILDEMFVVKRIMNAVLRNQPIIMIPRFTYFLVYLRSWMPHKVLILLAHYTRLFDVMKTFVGRKNN
uniref:Short chain dehydrogenase/reductase family 16C, member 5a n=1 Tax=Eptatretus burgeri TaxID=7764 RepID=A0A8C4NG23_EPTBU